MRKQVSHPEHYQTKTGIEVIEMIEALGLGEGFCIGNAIKYAGRAGKKDPTKYIEDLEKAVWYLNRRIEIAKAEQEGRAVTRPNDMNPREEVKSGPDQTGYFPVPADYRPPLLSEHTAKLVQEHMKNRKDSSVMPASTSIPNQEEQQTDFAFAASKKSFYVSRKEIQRALADMSEFGVQGYVFTAGEVPADRGQHIEAKARGDINIHGSWFVITPEGQLETVAFIPDFLPTEVKEIQEALHWMAGKSSTVKVFMDPEGEEHA